MSAAGADTRPEERVGRRICVCGKRCYTSREKAKEAHAQAGWRFRIYYCDDGQAWHITNGDKRGSGENKHWRKNGR